MFRYLRISGSPSILVSNVQSETSERCLSVIDRIVVLTRIEAILCVCYSRCMAMSLLHRAQVSCTMIHCSHTVLVHNPLCSLVLFAAIEIASSILASILRVSSSFLFYLFARYTVSSQISIASVYFCTASSNFFSFTSVFACAFRCSAFCFSASVGCGFLFSVNSTACVVDTACNFWNRSAVFGEWSWRYARMEGAKGGGGWYDIMILWVWFCECVCVCCMVGENNKTRGRRKRREVD